MRAGAPAPAVALVASAAVLTLLVTPASLAATASTTSIASAASAASGSPGSTPSAAGRATVGGPLMASHGVVVHYPPGRHVRRLPKVPASAYVIADASTGQVLAAKDPHGTYGPASTLKVLTAITLIPRLNPKAMITASQARGHGRAERRRPAPRPQVPDRRPVQGPAADLRQRRRRRADPGHRLVRQGHGPHQRRGAPPAGLRRRRQEAQRPARRRPGRVGLRRGADRPAGAGNPGLHALRLDAVGQLPGQDAQVGDPGQPEHPADPVPRRHRRQDRLDREVEGHLHRHGPAQRRDADRDDAALPPAGRRSPPGRSC